MQDPQSLHKYLYVHGDPIQSSDPTGLFPGFPYPRLFPGAPLPDEIQIPVLGTLVHSFIGQRFRDWANQKNLTAWANQQNRTIVRDITGVTYPQVLPFTYKPDMVSWAGGALVKLYEMKHADIVLNGPLYVGQSVLATAQLTRKGFVPLSTMAPGVAFGFGTEFARGYNVWPTFPWSPPGWRLVTWNAYERFPGVILYDWVPTKLGIQIEAMKGISGFAAAYAIQRIVALRTLTAAASNGSRVVLAERHYRAGTSAPLTTVATVAFVGLSIGF